MDPVPGSVALGFFNVRLVQALRQRHRRRLEMMTAGDRDASATRAQREVTLTLIGVICVFITCQTPTLVDHVLRRPCSLVFKQYRAAVERNH